MEKQVKKNENKEKEVSKVGKRRGKKEINKILTKKDIMDQAFERIRAIEKMRESMQINDSNSNGKVNKEGKESKEGKDKVDKKATIKKTVKDNQTNNLSTTNNPSTSNKPSSNTKDLTKRKSPGYVWVKKRNPSKETQTLKIYTNPVDRTRAALLDKLERKLNDYFSVVPEDLKKVNVLKVLQSLKGNKTITVSIGECSYIFEGEKIESNEKFKDPRIKEIISNMVKSLRNL